jgi:uncharacterized protein involved in response to NO
LADRDTDSIFPRRRFLPICCAEPFRIFFPAGAVLGVIGVSLWPLFYLGAGVAYPNIAHARLMIEGLMGSFIFGFLGTAGPRLTGAPHFSLSEVGTIFTFDLLAGGFHVSGANQLGDICFVVCLVVFALALAKRFRQRKDSLPPNFVLVGLGLVSAIAGTVLIAAGETAQYSRAYQFGSALLNQSWVLLQVIGVAPFFIRRLLDLPTPDLPESRALAPQWKREAALAALIGVVIIVSFWIDVIGLPRTGGWIRAGAIGFCVLTQIPFRGRTFLANSLRGGIMSIFFGFVGVALVPLYRIGLLHIVFITGFNLVAFTVASRVVFGHSGNLPLLRKRLGFFIATITLLVLAMLSRVSADFVPRVRTAHLIGAAICWLLAAAIWMSKVIPKVAVVERE